MRLYTQTKPKSRPIDLALRNMPLIHYGFSFVAFLWFACYTPASGNTVRGL